MMGKLDKKGEFAIKEVLELLLAVICILLILGFILFIWNVFSNQDSQNAKKTIDRLEVKLNSLEDNMDTKFTFQGFQNSQFWYFMGWNKNDINRPEKCYFSNCICICKDEKNRILRALLGVSSDERKVFCQKNGFCRMFTSNVNVSLYIPVNPSNNYQDFVSLTLPGKNALGELKVKKVDENGGKVIKVEACLVGDIIGEYPDICNHP